MSISQRESYTRRILEQLQACPSLSQRALSRNLGIALGLTNHLLRGMVENGWVEMVRPAPNRVHYVITAAGVEQEATISRDYFCDAVHRYREMRDRIGRSLLTVSADWPPDGANPPEKRVVFYGAGEIAEIGFICLRDVDLRLVGIVDEVCRDGDSFFGYPVRLVDALTPTHLDGRPFDRVIVMSFDKSRRVPPALATRGVGMERVAWL